MLIVLFFFSVINIVAGLATNSWVSVLHTLSVGFVGSFIFYLCVVFIPEQQKKNRVRNKLQEQYRFTKLRVVDLLLMLSKSQFYPYRDRENLLDRQEFKRFFNNSRWAAVANGLQRNEYHLREVLYYLRMLNEEIRHAMTVIDIDDEEVTKYLKNCSQGLSRMDMIQNDYEDIKLLCRDLLWPLFTGYSFVDGYSDIDVIQAMIDRIK